jgi:EmrB/QacA subfamily drug resistance transporter
VSSNRRAAAWTLGIVSLGLFMVVLDNLVVSVALPSIHRSLGASIQSLEWTVNAYVLSYAVLLLPGAALGDRLGRKRAFVAGLALFTVASAASALAPSAGLLITARVVQGAGAAVVTPLTLTLLAGAFPAQRRGLALGVWSAVSGVGVALGPLVGGLAIQLADWHWIFWINVPVGVVLAPLAAARLTESRGPGRSLDLTGLALASAGLLGIVFGLIRAQTLGWATAQVLASLTAGAGLIAAFILVELRSDDPMLPMSFFARRGFTVTNVVSLAMYFGMFGSVFFLGQFLQNVLGNTALQAGLKLLTWTGSTMVVSPAAGYLSQKYGSRPFLVAGLGLQAAALAWMQTELAAHMSYAAMIGPFIFGGAGMALVFAPAAAAVLATVRDDQAGQASGANNAIRELGGVLGIAVLSTVFTAHGDYGSSAAFLDGLRPALWAGIAVLAAGALIAAAVPFGPPLESGNDHDAQAARASGAAA